MLIENVTAISPCKFANGYLQLNTPMRLIIDGYNLLNASSIFAAGRLGTSLQRSREALLEFLGKNLNERLRKATVVAFDATFAPPGLPSEEIFRAILVRFARRGQEADDLIEELIASEIDPRNLLVVSSDHRLQRAARQRGASFVDSETWYSQILNAKVKSSKSGASTAKTAGSEKPDDTGVAEVKRWLEEFGPIDADETDLRLPTGLQKNKRGSRKSPSQPQPSKQQTPPTQQAAPKETLPQDERPSASSPPPLTSPDKSIAAGYNPFPPEFLAEIAEMKAEDLSGEALPPRKSKRRPKKS
jgi:predicted RNA-binding protein with PIN domain